MNIGIISDVHANVYGLNVCVEDLFRRNAELILCAGDIVGYYPLVNEAINLLRKWNVITILGNHDVYLLREKPISSSLHPEYAIEWTEKVISPENRSYLHACPENYCMEIDGITLAMFHGSPWHIDDYIYPDSKYLSRFAGFKETIIILGHTHYPMLKTIPDGPLLINSGSCGQPRDGIPLASYSLLDTVAGTVSVFRVPYDIDALVKATKRARLPTRNIDILYGKNANVMSMDFSTPQMIENFQIRSMDGA